MSDAPAADRGGRYLPPRLIQSVGLSIILAAAVYWAVTGHQSALIMGAGFGLVGIGAYSAIHISVRQEIDEGRREQEGRIDPQVTPPPDLPVME